MIAKHSRRRATGRQRGFTLIELAVVLMIISILMLVTFSSVTASRENAKRNVCWERQRKVYEVGLLYAAENTVADGPQNVALLVPDDLVKETAECPSSENLDYDDFTIMFLDGGVDDVICNVKGDLHAWAP